MCSSVLHLGEMSVLGERQEGKEALIGVALLRQCGRHETLWSVISLRKLISFPGWGLPCERGPVTVSLAIVWTPDLSGVSPSCVFQGHVCVLGVPDLCTLNSFHRLEGPALPLVPTGHADAHSASCRLLSKAARGRVQGQQDEGP